MPGNFAADNLNMGNMRTFKALTSIILFLFCMATEMKAQQHGSLLDEKQLQVAAISMYTSQGDQENLKTALDAGQDAGLTVNETKEILVQLYAYCGFPRSMSALGTLMTVLEERKGKGVNDEEGKLPSPLPERNSVEFGAANQRKLFGRDAQGGGVEIRSCH